MSQVQLEAFFLVQNACTAFPSTLVSMLELSPPPPILPLLRVAGLFRTKYYYFTLDGLSFEDSDQSFLRMGHHRYKHCIQL
jgi:hypothetical protein